MADSDFRAAERAWRSAPESEAAIRDALAAFERAGEDPPWELLAASPRWRGVTSFLGQWYARRPGPEDGSSSDSLAETEDRLGSPLPLPLREWFLLAGNRPDLAPRSWNFNDLIDLSQLEADSEGWIDLGRGHQGNGTWGIQLNDPAARVHVYYGFWQEDGAIDQVGSLHDFFLSSLVEEFTWNGARGAAEGVVHSTYWNLEECLAAAEASYARQPIISLYGSEDDPRPLVFGDEETLINVNDPEPVYVLTRTEAARERATEVFGPAPE